MRISFFSRIARLTLSIFVASLVLFSFIANNHYAPAIDSALAAIDPGTLNVQITNPTDGAYTDSDFTLAANTFYHDTNSNSNFNTNTNSHCTWALDTVDQGAMNNVFSPTHWANASGLSSGEHTIRVDCSDSNPSTFVPSANPFAVIPVVYAYQTAFASVTFTVVNPLQVIIDNPTEGAFTDPAFTLQAHTVGSNGNSNSNNNTNSACTWSLDGGGSDSMTGSFQPAHTADVADLAPGSHSITVDCTDQFTDYIPPSFAFVPAAYAINTASATVNFTVGTENGGGANYHRACQENMCIWVSGAGSDSCTTNSQCSAGSENSNVNDNGGGAANNNENNNGGSNNTNSSNGGASNTNSSGGNNTNTNSGGANGGEIDYGALLAGRCNLGETLQLRFSQTPNDYISRGDFIDLIMSCEGSVDATLADQNPFPDVNKTKHYAAAIVKAWKLGIITGYPDKKFRPDQTINRVEALRVILNFLFGEDNIKGGTMDFKDTEHGQWYEKYVAFAQLKGIVSGYRDADGNLTGYFGPADGVTYAQAAKMYGIAKGW